MTFRHEPASSPLSRRARRKFDAADTFERFQLYRHLVGRVWVRADRIWPQRTVNDRRRVKVTGERKEKGGGGGDEGARESLLRQTGRLRVDRSPLSLGDVLMGHHFGFAGV